MHNAENDFMQYFNPNEEYLLCCNCDLKQKGNIYVCL